MTAECENPFWKFSLAAYGRPGVAEACLALQDRRGLDVNLLLLCCWTGSRRQILDRDDMAALADSVAEWQGSVVAPLRALRRRLKGLPGAESGELGRLRQALKDCELAAERIEQAKLHDGLPPPSRSACPPASRAGCAAANLAVYFAGVGFPSEVEDKADLDAIVRGIFGPLPPETAEGRYRE